MDEVSDDIDKSINGYDINSQFLIVDVETTGLPTKRNAHYSEVDVWPRIVQMSWGIYDITGKELKFDDHIINPKGMYNIPDESAAIHGITNKIAKEKGKSIKKVLKMFRKDVTENENLVAIISHNINFDLNVIKSEYSRINRKLRTKGKEIICTMLATTNFCKLNRSQKKGSAYKYPKLEELYQILFNCQMEKAHDSKYDVINLAKCFFHLLNNYQKSGTMKLTQFK